MSRTLKIMGAALFAATVFTGAAQANPFDAAVEALNPLAYYNLQSATPTTTTDAASGYTMSLNNGALVQSGAGPTINGSAVPGLVLSNGLGGTEYAGSGPPNPETGGISSSGTILAWINLAALPSTLGRIFSIAGSSANGDDFDLQIDNSDDQLRFYTDGGSYTGASTDFTSSDLNEWVFVAATFTANSDRTVYIDGVSDGTSTPGGHGDSNNPFYIGQSNAFGGRYFDGSIADVAFFDTDLSSSEISALYADASVVATNPVPEPLTLSLFGAGLAGAVALRRRKKANKTQND